MMRTVSGLKGFQVPLERALCSSCADIVPLRSVSTLEGATRGQSRPAPVGDVPCGRAGQACEETDRASRETRTGVRPPLSYLSWGEPSPGWTAARCHWTAPRQARPTKCAHFCLCQHCKNDDKWKSHMCDFQLRMVSRWFKKILVQGKKRVHVLL